MQDGFTWWVTPSGFGSFRTHSEAKPGVIVLNTGNAMMSTGRPRHHGRPPTLSRAYREAPDATIVAVHMDAVNHCVLHRPELRMLTRSASGWIRAALIPADGRSAGLLITEKRRSRTSSAVPGFLFPALSSVSLPEGLPGNLRRHRLRSLKVCW